MSSAADSGAMKDNFMAPVQSSYFADRDDLVLGDDDIVVVSCMRNEFARLPYFLEYYRRMGVTRFLLVDNDSTDGTRDFLEEQPDVEYFWTNSSYRGSSAGRLWMQELADKYAVGHWVLTVDVDELLVFPGSELLTLRELCSYLDDNDQAGLFTVMLDMYSDRPLSQTRYEPGTDFVDTCPYFETDSYWLSAGSNPPFLSVFGGPRDRLFRQNGQSGVKPMMKKVPLVKWYEGFSYIFSTHSHRFIQLSDVTGVLLHFKFFASFQQVASEDAMRGDRRQQTHYSTYREGVESDPCFYGTKSCMYQGPAGLTRMGVMRWTARYQRFLETYLRTTGDTETDPSVVLPRPIAPEGSLTLRSMAAVWPIINNTAIPEYFGERPRPAADLRRSYIEEMSRHIKVLDVQDDHLLVRLAEPALHRWQRSKLGLAVYVGRRLVATSLLDGVEEALSVAVDSLEPGVCRFDADIAGGALHEGVASRDVAVTVYLFDGEDEGRLTPAAQGLYNPADPEDIVIYSRPWSHQRGLTMPEFGFRGGIDRILDGQIRGWVYDAEQDTFDVSVCLYLNGRLARHAWPAKRRRDIEDIRKTGSGARGRGFVIDMPLGYVEGVSGGADTAVEVVVAGRNLTVHRSPLVLPYGTRDARWDHQSERWLFGDEQPVQEPVASFAGGGGSTPAVGTTSNGVVDPDRPWWRVWS